MSIVPQNGLLEEVLRYLEEVRGPDRSGWFTSRCPRPEAHKNGDARPSFRLREGGFKCLVPVCPLHEGGSIYRLARLLGLLDAPPPAHTADSPPTSSNGRRYDHIADPLSWWAERCGVPRGWLERLPLEARDGSVAFCWPGLETVKLRTPRSKGWWEPQDAPRPALWPALPETVPPVLVLLEGESDTTVARYVLEAAQLQHLASAHALTKGAAARPEGALLRELAARGVRGLLLVPDADEAGQRWADAWQEAARAMGLRASVLDLVGRGLVSPSLGEKDIRDAYRRQPARLMAEMKAAVEALAGAVPSTLPGTNMLAVPAKVLAAADILASPAAEEMESLPFLGQDSIIIRGWSHLVAAPPKCGKTEALWGCVREWDAEGLRVLWASEETESVWRQRLQRDGAQVAHARWLLAAGWRAEDILAALKEASAGFDVVIVDTLRHLFAVDEGDNALVARTIAGLDEAIGREKTRIYLHHTRKAPGQHGERTAGGLAFVGGVDRQLELSWDEHDDGRRVLKGVSRIAPVPELLLGWEGGRLRVLGAPSAVALAEVRERVLGVLSESWQTTAQVIERLGEPKPSDRQVREALRGLAQEGLVEREPPIGEGDRPGRAYRWRLYPDDGGPQDGENLAWNGQHISSSQGGEVAPSPPEGGDNLTWNGARISSRKGSGALQSAPGEDTPSDAPSPGAQALKSVAEKGPPTATPQAVSGQAPGADAGAAGGSGDTIVSAACSFPGCARPVALRLPNGKASCAHHSPLPPPTDGDGAGPPGGGGELPAWARGADVPLRLAPPGTRCVGCYGPAGVITPAGAGFCERCWAGGKAL